jgi:hypothetical protein
VHLLLSTIKWNLIRGQAAVCPNYTPNTDSQYVSETAGFTQRHNVNVGTDIDFEFVQWSFDI